MTTKKKTAKKLELDSRYEKHDLDGDGVVTDEELEKEKSISFLEKADAQRNMAWAALGFIIFFTTVLLTPAVDDSRISALGDLAGLMYIALAGVVGAYMGVAAYMSRQK